MGARISVRSWGLMALLWITLFSWGTVSKAADDGGDKISDVRVLIDISGSMKKNDPENLRAPALRLITQLLPNGSHSGVWTFGQFVNMLVARDEVDSAWKAQADQAAAEINSLGMYTNIEGVMKDASWDWGEPDPKFNRSLILLTDGLVDISKDPAENRAARTRILEELLPKLRDAGVKVHTVALSADADQSFLGQLSAATSGWHEQIQTAEQLERVFLKMFEKSVPVETLPLTDNKVLVDNSIKELTLLVFRKDPQGMSALISPDGKRYTHKKLPTNVYWRASPNYDLITISEPMAGQWQVDADVDPDNRVMVVTDLRLRTAELPNIVLAGHAQRYHAEMLESGKVITNPAFLDLVRVHVEQIDENGKKKEANLKDNGKGPDQAANDGRFTVDILEYSPAGEYELKLIVDGTTFKRARNHRIKVVDAPALVTTKRMSDGDPAHYMVNVVPYPDIIDPETVVLDGEISKHGRGSMAVSIPRVGANEWRLDMDINQGDIFEIEISLQGVRRGKRQADDFNLGTYRLGGGSVESIKKPEPRHIPEPIPLPTPTPTPTPAPVAEAEPEPEAKAESKPEPTSQPAPKAEPPAEVEHADAAEAEEGEAEGDEEPNWLWVIGKVLLFNLIIIGAGYFVYRKWFAAPKKESEDDAESEEGAEAEGAEK